MRREGISNLHFLYHEKSNHPFSTGFSMPGTTGATSRFFYQKESNIYHRRGL
jgi:hypothetical protein